MDKLISFKGLLATRDEMSYQDWEVRLRLARLESKQGKGISLDTYLKRRAAPLSSYWK